METPIPRPLPRKRLSIHRISGAGAFTRDPHPRPLSHKGRGEPVFVFCLIELPLSPCGRGGGGGEGRERREFLGGDAMNAQPLWERGDACDASDAWGGEG